MPAGDAVDRVHAVEYRWLDALCAVKAFAYRLLAARFRPFGEPLSSGCVVTDPLGPPNSWAIACNARPRP
ncbi:DUF6886 family protein [Amycolatopsis sp. CFH S0740]|uniref:DUF6886 family protein n=1 Tax=unclassified Amycolatopsis TaxID=2618356 RepID=UPI00351430F5